MRCHQNGNTMDSIRQYFSDTEHATMSLFDNLNFYLDLLAEINSPIFISNTSDVERYNKEYDDWIKLNRKKILIALEKEKEYFGYTISKATICGSILQIAFMAILHFSKNTKVPEKFCDVVKEGSKAVKFCLGGEIRGVPKGLIIYAGRNQYNHMDDTTYNMCTTYVFEKLSIPDIKKTIKDPAFDLNHPKIVNYASNIVAILGWNDYANYITDMFDLLKT